MREITIRPKKVWSFREVEEIWQYRELLYIFVWRDIKVKYKQTLLGVLWVIFQPLLTMLIFTVFFGNLAKVPSGNLPYSLFVLCGLVFWNFFSSSISHASDSMIANEAIIKRVYFPKIILPVVSIMTSFLDLTINFLLLMTYAAILGFFPNILGLIVIPISVIVTSITAVGVGLFLSSINVKYRDVRYMLPFFIQILIFVTPVIYPLAIVSERNKYIMALNPLTSVIESVRLVFSGGNFVEPNLLVISFLSTVMIFLIGFWYFRKTELFFADIV